MPLRGICGGLWRRGGVAGSNDGAGAAGIRLFDFALLIRVGSERGSVFSGWKVCFQVDNVARKGFGWFEWYFSRERSLAALNVSEVQVVQKDSRDLQEDFRIFA